MSSSDEEELLLNCKRKRILWWMHESSEKREHLGEYHLQLFFFHKVLVLLVTCIVQEHVLSHFFN